jgi:hypothetical protein
MPNESASDIELTPEAVEVLKDIHAETQKLREIALAETPPATVFHAD